MRNKITALDIALLFNEQSLTEAYRVNRLGYESWHQGFLFDGNHLPHVTLYQGFSNEVHLDAIHKKVGQCIKQFPCSVELEVTGYSSKTSYPDIVTMAFDLNLKQLQPLHVAICESLQSLTQNEQASASCFYQQQATKESQAWVRDYLDQASFERFAPHLTLGFSKAVDEEVFSDEIQWPDTLLPVKIVSAQLGDHCTVSQNIYNTWSL